MTGLLLSPNAVVPASGWGLARTSPSPWSSRRRRALLRLARRNGAIRVALRVQGRVTPHSADLTELLDDLSGAGLLRWGGLRREHDSTVAIYLAA